MVQWRTAAACAALALTAVWGAAPVPAQGRPDTRNFTCAALNDFVASRGAVVMTTGRFTFERFVSGRRFCDYWERARPERVASRDSAACVVNFTCARRLNDLSGNR